MPRIFMYFSHKASDLVLTRRIKCNKIKLPSNSKEDIFMYARDFRNAAWQKLTGNWGMAVAVFLIYSLIVGVASATGVGAVAVFVLGGALEVGLVSFSLRLSRTGTGKLDDLFEGFRTGLGSNMIAGMLTTLYTFLWSLLFVIPGIVKSYSYAMTFYILADNPDMAPTEAITRSREMMNGNKWRLFCLDFSFIGWLLLSALTFGILTLWVAPYMAMARAQFYESLKNPQANETFEGGMAQNG